MCEKRGPRAGSCDSVLQLAMVLQNSNHDMPAELKETGCAAEDLPPVKPRSASPTAVQRLAALHTGAAGSVNPGQLHHKKHLHRKKRVGCCVLVNGVACAHLTWWHSMACCVRCACVQVGGLVDVPLQHMSKCWIVRLACALHMDVMLASPDCISEQHKLYHLLERADGLVTTAESAAAEGYPGGV